MTDKNNDIVRNAKLYREETDPQTGEKQWVEDSKAKSFGYTTEELERWVKEGVIPKELGEFGLQYIKKTFDESAEMKKLIASNASEEERLNFLRKRPTTMEDLKKQIDFHRFVLDNKDYLLRVIEEGGKKKRKFRQSAHYVEQKLKYEKPNGKQQNIFDLLEPETQDKIKNDSVHYIGIRLTPPEDKLVNSITRLLESKSQTKEPGSEDFYMGNETARLIPYGKEKATAAVLRFKKHELLTEFFGTKTYSGSDLRYFDGILTSFLDKKWLIRYKRTVQVESKNNKVSEKRHSIIEDYLPLIKVLAYFPNLTDEQAEMVENHDKEFRAIAGEYLLALNPILTDQINSKYVEFPEDIDYRTRIAAGGHGSVSEAVIRLRDWLISEMSASRYKPEINEETLIHRLHLEKYIKTRQKNRLQKQLNKAIQVSRHLGVILDVEESTGSSGQKKYTFKLNKDFE